MVMHLHFKLIIVFQVWRKSCKLRNYVCMSKCHKQAVSPQRSRCVCWSDRLYHIQFAWGFQQRDWYTLLTNNNCGRSGVKTTHTTYFAMFCTKARNKWTKEKQNCRHRVQITQTYYADKMHLWFTKAKWDYKQNAPEQHSQACLSNNMQESIFIETCQWIPKMQHVLFARAVTLTEGIPFIAFLLNLPCLE